MIERMAKITAAWSIRGGCGASVVCERPATMTAPKDLFHVVIIKKGSFGDIIEQNVKY
jgi:hypothetical protein